MLAAAAGGQVLYLDGQQVGSASGTITGGSAAGQGYDYIGTGFLGYPWSDQPHDSTERPTGYPSSFNGDIAEVAFYPRPADRRRGSAQWDAAQHSAGLSPVETTRSPTPAAAR